MADKSNEYSLQKKEFTVWLSRKYPSVICRETFNSLQILEKICVKWGTVKNSFWESNPSELKETVFAFMDKDAFFRVIYGRRSAQMKAALEDLVLFMLAPKDEKKLVQSRFVVKNERGDIVDDALSISKMIPVSCEYRNENLLFDKTWKDLYIKLISRLILDFPEIVKNIDQAAIYTSEKKMLLGNVAAMFQMSAPFKLIAGKLFLETDFSLCEIVENIGLLLNRCSNLEGQVLAICQSEQNTKEKLTPDENKDSTEQVIAGEEASDTANILQFEEIESNLNQESGLEDSYSLEIQLKAFEKWLLSNKGYSIKIPKQYTDSIYEIEQYQKDHMMENQAFSGMDLERLRAASKELMNDHDFIAYNRKSNFRLSITIKFFIEFVKSDSKHFLEEAKRELEFSNSDNVVESGSALVSAELPNESDGVLKNDSSEISALNANERASDDQIDVDADIASWPLENGNWTVAEKVLLVQLYFECKNRSNSYKKNRIEEFSGMLRKAAKASELEIDEKYRNIAGITIQYKLIENIVENRSDWALSHSKTSSKACALLKSNVNVFNALSKGLTQKMVSACENSVEKAVENQALQSTPNEVSSFDLSAKKGVLLSAGSDSEKLKNEFYMWLLNVEKMAKSSCTGYKSAVTSAEAFAKTNISESCGLFVTDEETVKRTVDSLMSNPDFKQKNLAQHNWYFAALKKYLLFISGAKVEKQVSKVVDIVENDVVLIGTELPTEIDYGSLQRALQVDVDVKEKSVSLNEAAGIVVNDLSEKRDFSFTTPIQIQYFDQIHKVNKWNELYLLCCKILWQDYPHVFAVLSSGLNAPTVRICKIDDAKMYKIHTPREISNGYVVETKLSATQLMTNLRKLVELCNIDYENLKITYQKQKKETVSETKQSLRDFSVVSSQKLFFDYLVDKVNLSKKISQYYCTHIALCEDFAKKHAVGIGRLYDVTVENALFTVNLLLKNASFVDDSKRHQNAPVAALMIYSDFLATISSKKTDPAQQRSHIELKVETQSRPVYKNNAYEMVLKQYFKKGFRLESTLELRRFKRYYNEVNGVQLTDSDDDISVNIKALCIIYDGKAFLPNAMLSEELKQKLFSYIDVAFSNGKMAIYYQAIYTEFSEEFLDYHIHDADMLKAYLTFMGNGRFYINQTFISKEKNIALDPLAEIRSCLKDYGRSVENAELFRALPHLPQNKIKMILASNEEFVNCGRGEYFHESIIHLSSEELENIAEIISKTIEEREFIAGNELYDAIQSKYSYIIEENQSISMYGFRDALKVKLGNRFSFKGNIISRFGQELSMADVFAKYAKSHMSFTLRELQNLAGNLSTVIYFEPIYKNSLRISKDQFVTKLEAQFPIVAIDEALSRVCVENYISIQKVENFGVFPYAGYTWNSFLLEHYVADYSREYKLFHSSFNANECVGAIVKRSAEIDSFDDLIVDILIHANIELKKDTALEYLYQEGYLARRRYSPIESLIIKASAQRKRKG